MRDGETVEFGGNPEWNHEAMIASSFRAFCIYPYGNPLQGEEWAESLPVVPILEYAERTSLGRAEWMKVFAWMVDDQALERANEAFDEITERYQQIQQEPLPTSDSLRVFTGSVDQGKWTAPSGTSFIAHILKDAGARYVFADQKSPENINVSLEKIIELSGRADAWGVVMFQSNTDAITRADLVAQNPQNSFLIPASGRVFVANTAECDYFGWWVAHPDALLRNLRELFYGPNEHVLGTAGLSESRTKACFRWIQE
jgi:iron complex transport system substrate-binding protein